MLAGRTDALDRDFETGEANMIVFFLSVSPRCVSKFDEANEWLAAAKKHHTLKVMPEDWRCTHPCQLTPAPHASIDPGQGTNPVIGRRLTPAAPRLIAPDNPTFKLQFLDVAQAQVQLEGKEPRN